MSLGSRLKTIRGKRTQKWFASEMGVSKNTYALYERNERTPDANFLEIICRRFRVNPGWLLLGEGPVNTPTEPELVLPSIKKKFGNLTWDEDDIKWLVHLLNTFELLAPHPKMLPRSKEWEAEIILLYCEVFLRQGSSVALENVIALREGYEKLLSALPVHSDVQDNSNT